MNAQGVGGYDKRRGIYNKGPDFRTPQCGSVIHYSGIYRLRGVRMFDT